MDIHICTSSIYERFGGEDINLEQEMLDYTSGQRRGQAFKKLDDMPTTKEGGGVNLRNVLHTTNEKYKR